MYVRGMEEGSAAAGLAMMVAGYRQFRAAGIDHLTHPDLVCLLGQWETLTRQMSAESHRVLVRLQREASPVELGGKSWQQVLMDRLHISKTDARRRLDDAKELGPRVSLSGERQEPMLARVAAAQSAGRIGADHVKILRDFFVHLPAWVDVTTREQIEDSLVAIAAGYTPEELRKSADKLTAYLDQDGPEPDDVERARKRFLRVSKQQADGMVEIKGRLDPQLWASLEPILATFAAPGMCNPDDEQPCTKGTPSQAQIDGDGRSLGQRQHDALTAITRTALMSGELGQHNGLPVSVVISTTLQDLQAAAGCAVTAGGSLLPMRDVIQMASHAYHWLAVFDEHTTKALYCGRSKRIAPAAHRVVLFARDRGCTKPGCTVPAYGTQVHHTEGWARNHGQTNIDEETLACGADNRLAEKGWTTVVGPNGVEWIPPPELDVGQPRINAYHHPERLLAPPPEPEDEPPE
jgi:hypothetical protein